MTTHRVSPDATILAFLFDRTQATAAAIGEACRMAPGEVRARLVGLESRRLITGRQDARLVPPARAFVITGEGRPQGDAMVPTGWQIRQGRELIGLSLADLAEAASVGLAVVIRAELAAHMPMLTRRSSAVIQEVLEAAGVEFIHEDGGPGMQLRKAGQADEVS